MSLYHNQNDTNALLERLKQKGQISVYKGLKVYDNELHSPCFGKKKWKPGVNVSNRASTTRTSGEVSAIGRGLHCYTDRYRHRAKNYSYIVVRFTAKLQDFIACGKYGHAVFHKLTLDKKDYCKALGIPVPVRRVIGSTLEKLVVAKKKRVAARILKKK